MVENNDNSIQGLDRCILEIDGAAAGLLLRDSRGVFRFFASNPETAVLEGRTFHSPGRAEAEVRRVLRGDGRKA
ncbi:hypothetical protein SAE02_75830 [Skermanella aerolata]|uniref:Uncharacterized protein n=1 Tax=Skermanella aerolata TaxID=393310 RepID=A0A512E417_9PROT|nr:hypothetical protein [Skermanella aerolata]KJB90572.1 hypothetical protein N826_38950 [Skermanella aerolata KACC 11604]GEO43435.1 hypothetical protein SAE02_75830 [Skermanella aerolata]